MILFCGGFRFSFFSAARVVVYLFCVLFFGFEKQQLQVLQPQWNPDPPAGYALT